MAYSEIHKTQLFVLIGVISDNYETFHIIKAIFFLRGMKIQEYSVNNFHKSLTPNWAPFTNMD